MRGICGVCVLCGGRVGRAGGVERIADLITTRIISERNPIRQRPVLRFPGGRFRRM